MYTIATLMTPPGPAERLALLSWAWLGSSGEGGMVRTKWARTSIEKPQTPEPSFSQNRFPRSRTKMNMKERAERTLMMPKIPVRKREDETEVKPADMKMTGA